MATDADFLAFYGQTPPEPWLGVCAKEGERIVAFGVIIWADNGNALGFVDKKGPVSRFMLHREARRVLRVLKQVGEPHVSVMCDGRLPGAEYWLRKMGFAPVEDTPELWRVMLA